MMREVHMLHHFSLQAMDVIIRYKSSRSAATSKLNKQMEKQMATLYSLGATPTIHSKGHN
jgi:hypothetical protein